MKFDYLILVIFGLGQVAKNVAMKYFLVELENDAVAKVNEGKIIQQRFQPILRWNVFPRIDNKKFSIFMIKLF